MRSSTQPEKIGGWCLGTVALITLMSGAQIRLTSCIKNCLCDIKKCQAMPEESNKRISRRFNESTSIPEALFRLDLVWGSTRQCPQLENQHQTRGKYHRQLTRLLLTLWLLPQKAPGCYKISNSGNGHGPWIELISKTWTLRLYL